MRVIGGISIIISLVALSACDSTTTPGYQTSPENTIALMNVASAGERASVTRISATGAVDTTPTCRLLGALDIGGGKSTEQALQSALQAELLAAGVFSPSGTPITVTLTEFAPNSFDGSWTIGGTVSTPKLPEGFTVNTRFDFKTSFTAYSACRNTALAFNNAASQFINDIVTHPSFRQAI